jgi:transposase
MICRRKRRGKREVRFAEPPWDRHSPQWIALDEELPEDHVARTIVAGVASLDMKPLRESYSASGSQPHRPDLMLAVILIELHLGRRSPSQWHRDCRENQVLQWAGFGIRPARSCWYEFHDRVAPFVEQFNRQVLHTARRLGITPAKRAALDGSAIAANASRHRLLNESCLRKRMKELGEAIRADEESLLVDSLPTWMAKMPATRMSQHMRYQRAGKHLGTLLEANQQRSPCERRARENVVVSPSDPEAALGRDKLNVFRPLYNVQVVHDLDSALILGYQVFAQATDAVTLGPMIQRTNALTGAKLRTMLVDSGYVTGGDLAVCKRVEVTLYGPWKENDYSARNSSAKRESQISKDEFQWLPKAQTYRCPQGHMLNPTGRERRRRSGGRTEVHRRYVCPAKHCRGCPAKASCTTSKTKGRSLRRSEHEELIEAHRAFMETAEAKGLYKLRAQTAERIFADLKEHRRFRRFRHRGLHRCRTELGLTVLVHNLKEITRLPRPTKHPVVQASHPP